MKRKLTIVILLLLSSLLAYWVGYHCRDAKAYAAQSDNQDEFRISDSFYQNDGSQADLNEAAYREYIRADEKLNAIYKNLFREYKANKLFLSKLTLAEQAWIKYRDAYMESRFPGEDKRFLYGSAYPMSYNIILAEKTWERAKELDAWLHYQEGDVSAGSIGVTTPIE